MVSHHLPAHGRLTARRGFTLIELLVVVAIIALLISILLPSLSKARQQARTTLCGSRLSQMVKAMLIYCEDYSETPPFILKGDGDDANYCDDPGNSANWGKETWLAASQTMQRIYVLPETDWYTLGHPRLPESGDLFPYTRFAGLYRCPEFERISDSRKDQNAFNYTRNLLGRKMDIDALVNTLEMHYLGIIKVSGIYNPACMPMMIDEAWDCYVGWAEPYGWVWGGHDPVWDIFNSCMGRYHGADIKGFAWFPETKPPGSEGGVVPDVGCKQASLGFYDGHVALERDPLPNMEHYGGRPPLNPLANYFRSYLKWIDTFLYAQQGISMNLPF
jgi:prepilin-type N-terminal cleavage/methylation domain-containing protein